MFREIVFEDGAAVKHDSDLIWFPWMVYVEVGKEPCFALFCTQLFIRLA